LGSFGPDDIGARISDLLECPELWPSIHSFNIMHGGLTPIEWANLQKLIPGLSNLREFSIYSRAKKFSADGHLIGDDNYEFPPSIAQVLFDLKKLEAITLYDFTKIKFPANCGTSMANLYVRNCASFNPGGLFTAESLKSLTLHSVVLAGQDCPADFSSLEKLEVDVSTITQNENFFSKAKYPVLETLTVDVQGSASLNEAGKKSFYRALESVAADMKSLVFSFPELAGGSFDWASVLSRCTTCKSVQFGSRETGSGYFLREFAKAVEKVKKSGGLPALQTLKFAAKDLQNSDAEWRKLLGELKKIPNLEIQELPKNS
jgi:hypothetical protein